MLQTIFARLTWPSGPLNFKGFTLRVYITKYIYNAILYKMLKFFTKCTFYWLLHFLSSFGYPFELIFVS